MCCSIVLAITASLGLGVDMTWPHTLQYWGFLRHQYIWVHILNWLQYCLSWELYPAKNCPVLTRQLQTYSGEGLSIQEMGELLQDSEVIGLVAA